MTLLLGVDLGSSSIKAVLLDSADGQVVRFSACPTPTRHPRPDWSEHDPQELLDGMARCVREVCSGDVPAALSISSFAEAGVPLDASGNALYPIVSWYDRRCQPQADRWDEWIDPVELHAITGQRSSPSFGVNKLLWFIENYPVLAARMTRWLSTPDYLFFRLTGESATDHTIASRTMLFDQSSRTWSSRLLNLAGIRAELLPPVLPSGTPVGSLTRAAAELMGLPAGLPCILGGHDHLCAALAAGLVQPGTLIDSIGTAEALMLATPRFLTSPQLARQAFSNYAHIVEGLYIFKGGLKLAGGALDWLESLTGARAAALEPEAAIRPGTNPGPLWLLHLIGSGSPEGDPHSMAAVIGLRAHQTRADLLRGMLISMACWTRQNLEIMTASADQNPAGMIMLGGLAKCHSLAELKAAILGMPVFLSTIPEASAVGAALLAGLGVKTFANPREAVQSLRYPPTRVDASAPLTQWLEAIYHEAYLPLYASISPVHAALRRVPPL